MRCLMPSLLLLSLPALAPAADTIQRCVAADGTMVYTDKPCGELDAKPAAPALVIDKKTDTAPAPRAPLSNQGGAVSLGGVSRDDCIRRTDTLLFELRAGIEGGNVNRLASVYDWAGKSAGAAVNILDRLARLAEHPAATVEFRYHEPDEFADSAAYAAPPPEDARPVAVTIVEMAPGAFEPRFEDELRLVRNAACWWVSY